MFFSNSDFYHRLLGVKGTGFSPYIKGRSYCGL
jgi:hypothetical protein